MSEEKLKGPKALFFIQIFSTLAYSILYSTLVLYMTKKFDFGGNKATAITASFLAFNYVLHLLGGYIGGRLLSFRELFVLGMITQIIGTSLLAVSEMSYLYWGLAFFLSGAGLNNTCVNCMLTQLFSPKDKRREAVFLWNYSGMNLGFLIGFTVSGYFQMDFAYSKLFLFAALGNLVAIVIALINWKALRDQLSHFALWKPKVQWMLRPLGILSIVLLILVLHWLLEHATFSNNVVLIAGALMAVVIAYLAFRQPTKSARKKIWAYLIFAFDSVIFSALHQMVPLALTLFVLRNVDRKLFGYEIPPQWFANINAVTIIIGGPLIAAMYTWLRKRGWKINIPSQFTLALFLIGVGFLVLPLGIYFSNNMGYTSISWIIWSYFLMSLGELFISPIGNAMIGQLAPVKLQGLLMGTWLMITGIAVTLSNLFSQYAFGKFNLTNPLDTNNTYSHIFNLLGWGALACALIMLFLIPFLHKLIRENYEKKCMEPHPQNAPEDTDL